MWLTAAYWLHLFLPLFLLVDVLHARWLQMQQTTDTVLGILSALWLLIAPIAYFVTRDRAKFMMRARGPLVSFYAVIFTFAVVELGLRVLRQDMPPAIWRPGLRLVFTADPHIFPGVSKVTHFRANEYGLRGPSLPGRKDIYKIVAVGGSTTLCLMLDDQATWPQQLMQELDNRQNKLEVWVANAGVNGHTVAHHLVTLGSLPILRQANLVVFLAGINDFQDTLAHEGKPTQALIEQDTEGFREHLLSGDYSSYPLYRRLRVYRFFRRATDLAIERTNRGQQEETLDESGLRKLRRSEPILPMPDLSVGLVEYRKRLEDLAGECHLLGVRCLFITQPSLWHSDLSPSLQKLLIFGWLGLKFQPKGYASVSDLESGMDSYNQVMLDICKETAVECYDLAAVVPKDSSIFYDDVHFTEKGAQFVAHSLTTYILSQPPFNLPSESVAADTNRSK